MSPRDVDGVGSSGTRALVVSHEATRTGAPRVALELVRALDELGWSTTAVLRWGGPLRGEFEATADSARLEPWAHLRAALGRRRRTRKYVPALSSWAARRVVERLRPDLVWCNTMISVDYAVAASRLGVRSVLFSHEQTEIVRRSVERAGLAAAMSSDCPPLLLGCSPEAASTLAAALELEPESVGVLRSPVDVERVRSSSVTPPAGRPAGRLVVACGTADHRKGVDVFIAAAELAAAEGQDATWCWVGSPRGHVSPCVTFVGEVDDAQRWIAASSVFVLPSRAEAFPLVVLEAMASGRAIVASDLPGPAEQLGSAGVLVPVGDSEALFRRVASLLDDPGAAADLGGRALDRCRERWDVAVFRQAVSDVLPRGVET